MKIRYQNEKLRKRVEEDSEFFPINAFCVLLGLTLCTVSIVLTVRDMSAEGLTDISGFWKILSEQHPIWLAFGITALISGAICINLSRGLNMLKHLRPACSSKRYTPEEIDAEANSPDAKWYAEYDIYVTPNVLIGTNRGMTVVQYSDIRKAYIRSRTHTETKWHPGSIRGYSFLRSGPTKTYETERLIIITKRHRRLVLSEDDYLSVGAIRKIIEEKCGPDVWKEN